MKLLTLARDLQRRKARERHGLFVGEGLRVVEELSRAPIPVRGVLHTSEASRSERAATVIEALRAAGTEVAEVSERDFDSAAETESPQGILAIAGTPRWRLDDLTPGPTIRLLVLDAVQDPGNVGTILRTAAALGASATLALPGTVDLWNAKVVRSAMGAHFHHPALPVPGRSSMGSAGGTASQSGRPTLPASRWTACHLRRGWRWSWATREPASPRQPGTGPTTSSPSP